MSNETFIKTQKTTAVAINLLAAAVALDLPKSVVRTTSKGFAVPHAVAEAAGYGIDEVSETVPDVIPEPTDAAPDSTIADGLITHDATEKPEPEPEIVEEPKGNASLEVWQDFARSKGATEEDLDGKKRNDLADLYGTKE